MTDDPGPRIVPAQRGYSVIYGGKALLSMRDPAAVCERLVAALPRNERTLYLCVSPLFGWGLLRLLDTMHPSSAVLCLEADPSLVGFTREHFPKELAAHPRLVLLANTRDHDVTPAAAFATVANAWGHRAFRRVVRFDLSSGASQHAAYYEAVEEALRRETALEWENAATLVKLGRRYALNFLHNLRLLDSAPSVETVRLVPEAYEEYKGGSRGNVCCRPLVPAYACLASASSTTPSLGGATPKPPPGGYKATRRDRPPPGPPAAAPQPHGNNPVVHVLGAGPSLDRFFTDYRGGLIVCVDTALPTLRSHGLRADLAVALEAQHWNLRDFIGCYDTVRALAMDMSALPLTPALSGGTTYLFFTPWTPLHIFGRLLSAGLLPLEMPPLGNVGITAYALARRLFPAAEIIPHGLDFAFTIDRYHCRDSPGHIDTLRKLNRFHSLFPIDAALRPSAFPLRPSPSAISLPPPTRPSIGGEPLRQDPVMRRYEEVFSDVRRNNIGFSPSSRSNVNVTHKTATAFMREIYAELTRIRRILSGEKKASAEELRALLTRNDFLFAHYPDYAATTAPANLDDLSFLKRIRAEIDTFIKALSSG